MYVHQPNTASPSLQLYPLTLYPYTLLHSDGLPTAPRTLFLSKSSFMHALTFYTHTKPISKVKKLVLISTCVSYCEHKHTWSNFQPLEMGDNISLALFVSPLSIPT